MPQLDDIAARSRWQHRSGKLIFPAIKRSFSEHKLEQVEVICSADAFADILQQSSLVIGITGTAVEQAVGLRKPVNAVPENGPAFTYRFAEAQNRLLGDSVQVITPAANSHIIKEAEEAVDRTLQDDKYLASCIKNGLERMGRSGGSIKIANYVANYL
jgi:uncharacterized protein (TIGR03492 family)